MEACGGSSSTCTTVVSELQHSLLSLATETLSHIVSYLTAYERLCLRITCKRFYLILSDPRVWHTLVWRDCGKRDSDYKALRLALKLSASTVQSISILYPRYQTIAKFLSQVQSCSQVRYLTLSGKLSVPTLNKLLPQLPSLYFLSITVENKDCFTIFSVFHGGAKTFEVLQLVTAEYCPAGLHNWQECGYFPPYLQMYISTMHLSWSVRNFVGHFSRSDHPAKLSFYPRSSSAAGNLVNQYPLLEVVLFPNVELASCHIGPGLPPLALCNGSLRVSSEESNEYISATHTLQHLNSPVPGVISLPMLPPSIKSLYLANLDSLAPNDLSSISECCPNLICMNIKGCSNALLSLSGLADISEKCLTLTSLNIKSISKVEGVATLWEVLASMKKLRHLAVDEPLVSPQPPLDEHCVSYVCSSVRRMNLTAFEIHIESDFVQLDILLPALVLLSHLHISGHVPRLTNFFT